MLVIGNMIPNITPHKKAIRPTIQKQENLRRVIATIYRLARSVILSAARVVSLTSSRCR